VAGSGGGVRCGERANTVESACKAGQEARCDAVWLVKGCDVEDTTSNGRCGGQSGGKEGLGGMEGGARVAEEGGCKESPRRGMGTVSRGEGRGDGAV
jgi:hypothetical protein